MRTTFQKWGKSVAIRIPKSMAERAGLEEGHEVEITLLKGRLIITPLHRKSDYKLDALLAGVTDDNLHPEANYGHPEGREVL